jgi:hypothetical protein
MHAIPIDPVNLKLAEALNAETRGNPNSPYAGKFLGIANGKLAVVADSWDELARRLMEIEPDRTKTLGLEASRDYTEVHRI